MVLQEGASVWLWDSLKPRSGLLDCSTNQSKDVYMEAYSWGVGEYDSEDGVDGGSEGCVGAAVVGVKDAPGFQLRDTSFYEVADSVDFLVELLFTVV